MASNRSAISVLAAIMGFAVVRVLMSSHSQLGDIERDLKLSSSERAEVESHFANFPSPAAAQQEGRDLAKRGLWRLPDSLLMLRMRLMLHMEGAVDAETCNALVTGAGDTGVMEKALATLSPDERKQWYYMSGRAMLAELHHDEPPYASDDEAGAAVRAVLDRMPPADAETMRTYVEPTVTAAQRCSAEQSLATAILAPNSVISPGVLRSIVRKSQSQ